MSYSFSILAETKSGAKMKVATEWDKVTASQSTHERDRDAAMTLAFAFIDMLPALDVSSIVALSMNGSLSGDWKDGEMRSVSGVSMSVNVGIRSRSTVMTVGDHFELLGDAVIHKTNRGVETTLLQLVKAKGRDADFAKVVASLPF